MMERPSHKDAMVAFERGWGLDADFESEIRHVVARFRGGGWEGSRWIDPRQEYRVTMKSTYQIWMWSGLER
jgi:hypothetical protein